jgi:hypothetical protein
MELGLGVLTAVFLASHLPFITFFRVSADPPRSIFLGFPAVAAVLAAWVAGTILLVAYCA